MAKVEKKHKVLLGVNIALGIVIFVLSFLPFMVSDDVSEAVWTVVFIVPGVIAIVGALVFWFVSFFKFKVDKKQKTAWILMLVWKIEFLLLNILGGLFLIIIPLLANPNGLYITAWAFLAINMIASPILYGMSIYYLNK